MLLFQAANAGIFISQQSGNWSDPNTWELDSTTYPTSRSITNGDTVIVKPGHTVTIFNNGTDYGSGAQPILYVQVEGVLTFKTGRKLIMPCGSGVKVLGGAIIPPGGGGGNSNVIDICNTVLWKAGDDTLVGPTDLGTTPTFPLPVTWLNVSVKEFENSHIILWATTEEENESHFEVLRSADLVSWEQIGQVDSKENGEYNFVDDDYETGFSYYRIRFVELNGISSLSKIVSIYSDFKTNQFSIQVFPNPSSDYIFVDGLDIPSASIQMKDSKGNIIAAPSSVVGNKIQINLKSLNSGIYFLIISDFHSNHTKEVMIN